MKFSYKVSNIEFKKSVMLIFMYFQFSNLLGTIYRNGNLVFTPDGNSVISPVGNRITVYDLKKYVSKFTLILRSPQ